MPTAVFVQEGNQIDHTPAAAVAAGAVVVLDDLIGIAKQPIDANKLGALAVTGVFDGVRCVAHDRLPLAGAVADEAAATAQASRLRGAHPADLPRRAGLFASFALGSRGLTLAPLAGEVIAAQLEGEPWPVEGDLAAALDPARFLLRRLRSGRPV